MSSISKSKLRIFLNETLKTCISTAQLYHLLTKFMYNYCSTFDQKQNVNFPRMEDVTIFRL